MTFSRLGQSLRQLAAEYFPPGDKRAVPCKFQPSVPVDIEDRSGLGRQFPDIAVNHFLQIPAFAQAADLFQTECVASIDSDSKDYEDKITEILSELSQINSEYTDALAKYNEIHASYVKAGHALVDKKHVKKVQDAFDKAKKAALQAHALLRTQVAQLSFRVETVLTEYEELELWRADRMEKFLKSFGEVLNALSESFIEGKASLFGAVHHLPESPNVNGIASFDKWQTARADDELQPFKVNPAICKLLPAEELFPHEVQMGMRLFRVISDFSRKGYLTVKAEEIVATSENLDNREVMCQNVNRSVGLLPVSILEPAPR